MTLSDERPTREGYFFLGWSELRTAREAAYLPGGSYTKDENTTLYAVWLAPDLILPSALTEIGEEAFAGGTFRVVELPENLRSIGNKAFADCINLEYIYIPEKTTSIDRYAFDGVEGLTILGKAGSTAERYADQYGFAFLAVTNGN